MVFAFVVVVCFCIVKNVSIELGNCLFSVRTVNSV